VRGDGSVELGLHDSGLDACAAPVQVDGEDARQPEAVDDDARADRLPGEARGRAAQRERQTVRGGDVRGGDQVVGRARDEHHLRDDAVSRGVGRVEPARERGVADPAGRQPPQRGGRAAAGRRGLGYAVAGAHRASI